MRSLIGKATDSKSVRCGFESCRMCFFIGILISNCKLNISNYIVLNYGKKRLKI